MEIMIETNPLVSVLMTAYNRAQFIAEAIESVLKSSYKNLELIVVDDCSTDETVNIARRYANLDTRVSVYVNEKNLTDYNNRNRAASYAKGKYLKYVDSDDMLYFYGLEVMVKYMEQYPQAGFGLSTFYENRPMPFVLLPKEIYLSHFKGYGHFNRGPLASIIKRDVFNKVGGFSGSRFFGDQELWMKLSMYYSMVVLPWDLVYYRTHDNSEAKIESKNSKQVNQLRHKVILDALSHSDCPLTDGERKLVKKQFLIASRKNEIWTFLHNIRKPFKRRL